MIKIILILLAATAAVCAAYTGPISQEETPVITETIETPEITEPIETPEITEPIETPEVVWEYEAPAQPETEAEQPIDGSDVSLRDLWEMSYE